MSWPPRAVISVGASAPVRLLVRRRKPHAYAADTVQVSRIRRGLAELASQPGEVNVDGPVASSITLTPDVRQQLSFCDYLTRPLRQGQQEVKLLARQVDWRSVQVDQAFSWVDLQAPHHQRALNGGGAAATKHRAQPGLDLFDPEWLDDVVVGAGVQGSDHVGIVVPSRDDDDGHIAHGSKASY